ncbi:methyl-accepting chemotaxis protein [Exilibacterium tricleocarpae]|uniref:Methyl-accepting chemotaxis protein n=1 Tax=Exilibacterium tricleocarpae TaxID=2591008 RepID=A0A545TUX3_9GAMM|nr:methyl-accepting chemotaxis protein [Exilibacterium tricleocarpae]TQV81023.1 methyl-accepting chemotaxis protein [Exilibacterium tricleocarpae]
MLRTLQSKLIAGLALMAVLVLISSVGGLWSVFLLEEQINTITDEAGPTIEETDDLIAALWESAKVANEILASEDIEEVKVLAEELEQLSASFVITSDTLKDIVDEPRYIALIDQAITEHTEFNDHSKKMIESHISELEEELKAKSLLEEFDSQGAKLIIMLDEFATENEQEMQKAENEGDAIVARNGSAKSVNKVLGELFEKDYPVVESSLKLQRLVVELQDTSGEYLAEENPDKLPQIKENFDELVESTKPFFEVLKSLAETSEDRQDAKDLVAAFDDWINLANSDERLFDSYRDQLDMEYKADFYTEELEKDVDNADAVLEEVAETSDKFMDSADETAAGVVAAAVTEQVIVAVISLTVSVAMVVIFIKLLVNPLKELAARLRDIAQGEGDLTQVINDTSNDEVGDLAKAFNLFVDKIRQLIKEISVASEKMSSSVSSMDTLIESVSQNVSSQSIETDSTATAINELSANAREINNNIQNVFNSTSSANKEAQQAKYVVEESVNAIRTLAGDIENSAEVIEKLSNDANSIGSVLTVIQGIAEQTNLLALNAAIEAARAGEQGRGFAVVADEVRTLAARTQNSTEEIQVMIESLQSGVSSAVKSMERSQANSNTSVAKSVETGGLLDNISASVTEVDTMIAQITTAVEQQSEVTNDINHSINTIVGTAQETSSAAEKTTEHSSGLKALGHELSGLVQQFKV